MVVKYVGILFVKIIVIVMLIFGGFVGMMVINIMMGESEWLVLNFIE